MLRNGLDANALGDVGEERGAFAADAARVASHDLSVGAHVGSEVDFVDDQGGRSA